MGSWDGKRDIEEEQTSVSNNMSHLVISETCATPVPHVNSEGGLVSGGVQEPCCRCNFSMIFLHFLFFVPLFGSRLWNFVLWLPLGLCKIVSYVQEPFSTTTFL